MSANLRSATRKASKSALSASSAPQDHQNSDPAPQAPFPSSENISTSPPPRVIAGNRPYTPHMSRLAQLAAEDSSILQRLGASNSPASRLSASQNQTSDLRPLRPSSASDSPPQSSENLNQNVPTDIQQAVAEAVAATADLTQASPELLRYLNLNPLALEMSLRDLQAQPQTPSTQVTIELTERLWHVANAMAEERATFLRVQQQQEQEKRRLFTLQAEQETLLERLQSVQAGTSNDPVLVTSSSSSSPPASRLRQPTPSLALRHLRSVANPPPHLLYSPHHLCLSSPILRLL